MYKYKDQKEMRLAINGRMITMIAGIFTVTTGLFTTLRYGMALFQSAGEAAKGTQEYLDAINQIGVGIGYIRFAAVYLLLVAMLEVFVGVFAVRLANRLDKSNLILKLCIALIAVEVILQPIVLRTQMMMLTNVLMPVCLLWGVLQLRKLAKIYPERTFAVDPNRNKNLKKDAAPQKKNLRTRAMAQVKEEEPVQAKAQIEGEVSETEKEGQTE